MNRDKRHRDTQRRRKTQRARHRMTETHTDRDREIGEREADREKRGHNRL